MTNKQAPVAKLRDGAIQASIFQNSGGDNGTFYAVQFSRTYQDTAGKYQSSTSFSGTELLKLARLAQQAYDQLAILRRDAAEDTETSTEADAA